MDSGDGGVVGGKAVEGRASIFMFICIYVDATSYPTGSV